jgi:hypothetical protein
MNSLRIVADHHVDSLWPACCGNSEAPSRRDQSYDKVRSDLIQVCTRAVIDVILSGLHTAQLLGGPARPGYAGGATQQETGGVGM